MLAVTATVGTPRTASTVQRRLKLRPLRQQPAPRLDALSLAFSPDRCQRRLPPVRHPLLLRRRPRQLRLEAHRRANVRERLASPPSFADGQ
jgi:hypothetical protein